MISSKVKVFQILYLNVLIQCLDHKTIRTSGSAKIGLSEQLYEMLHLFASSKELMGLPAGPFDPIFVGRKGAPMSSSNVATAVATDLMAAGTPFRATTNRIRHSVVSIVSIFNFLDKCKSCHVRKVWVELVAGESVISTLNLNNVMIYLSSFSSPTCLLMKGQSWPLSCVTLQKCSERHMTAVSGPTRRRACQPSSTKLWGGSCSLRRT